MRTKIGSIEIEYIKVGENTQNILILHGWGRGISDWQKIAEELGSNFQVWLLDLPGFGKSQNPAENWGVAEYAKCVEDFIKAQNLNELVLLGHSFGGRIAIELASKNPAYLKKLILVASAGIKPHLSFKKRLIKAGAKLGKLFIKLLPQKQQEKTENFFLKILAQKGVEYAQYPQLRNVFKRVVEKDLKPLLHSINVPTLLVWGENDKVIPLSDAKKMNEGIKNSTLRIIPGATHFPYFEKEAEFLHIVQGFLNTH